MTTEETKNTTEVISGKEGLDSFFSKDEEVTAETTTDVQESEEATSGMDSLFNEQKPTEKNTIVEAPTKKEVEAEKIQPNLQNDFYRNLIKENIEDGDWQDAEIDAEDEDGNPISVAITEIEDITPEVYRQLKDAQKALKDEDFSSKYISKDGLDENTLKMLDIKKAGGDISSLIQREAELIHPLKSYDLENENVQSYLVQQKLLSKGISAEDANLIIDRYRKDLTLDKEAEKVIGEINGNFSKQVESEKNKQLEEVQKTKDSQKEFKKTIKDTFQKLKFDEKYSKSLIEASANFDENGVTQVDNAYFEAKKNPELYAKIAFMLTNEEAFNDFMGIKAKNEANISALKKLIIKPRTSTTTSAAKKQDKKEGLEALFDSN